MQNKNPLVGLGPAAPAPQPIDQVRAFLNNPNQVQTAFQQFRQDPVQRLRVMGFNLPQNITTPEQAGQYLMQTGQISQDMINQIISFNPNFQRFFTR